MVYAGFSSTMRVCPWSGGERVFAGPTASELRVSGCPLLTEEPVSMSMGGRGRVGAASGDPVGAAFAGEVAISFALGGRLTLEREEETAGIGLSAAEIAAVRRRLARSLAQEG